MERPLPTDPAILLSYLNMKLRDDYDSVEALIDDLDLEPGQLEVLLDRAGIEYLAEGRRFVTKS